MAEISSRSPGWRFATPSSIGLCNDAGIHLVKTLGNAVRDKHTKVILGTVGLLPWFIKTSGLATGQVTDGVLGVQCYPPKAVTLPVHLDVDAERLANAAYVHCFEYGFAVDDCSPDAAQGFTDLYNACGVSRCVIKPAQHYAAEINPVFVVFAACELMDWPRFAHIHEDSALWSLTVAAVGEVQGLGVHGQAGQEMQRQTTETGLAAALAAWEKDTLPLELQAFNRYHHGGKVNEQDRAHLRARIIQGGAEGKPMAALKELFKRVEAR